MTQPKGIGKVGVQSDAEALEDAKQDADLKFYQFITFQIQAWGTFACILLLVGFALEDAGGSSAILNLGIVSGIITISKAIIQGPRKLSK